MLASLCLLASLPACRCFCWSLSVCWLLCQPAGVSAGLCLPAGFSVSLPAFLSVSVCLLVSVPICWSLCCAPFALVYRAIAGCLSFCLPVPGVLPLGGYIASVPLICAASTFYAFMFLVAQFLISVVHVDILLINACARAFSFLSFTYIV